MLTIEIAAGLFFAGFAAWETRNVLRAHKTTTTTLKRIKARVDDMDIKELMDAEGVFIKKMFDDHGISARIAKKSEIKSSFISYGLELGPGESLKRVESIQRELSNGLTRQRVSAIKGYAGRAVVRLRDFPLAIEVPHPSPTPLSWHSASMRMARNYALIGRSYSTGAREEYIDLDRHYHTLIAAMSGGGKSTMLRMALLTLALNTPSDELHIMLIDLKNDDLVPFQALPHCVGYAGDIEKAAEVIESIFQLKTERIASREKPYRMLLVIDELAELGPDKDALRKLGSILSTGRSLGINVWAGTQYPSAQSIGSVVAASFTTRLVGMVDGKTSANVATKRAGSGAEMLTLPGDFLRVDGGDLVRMKSYNIDDADTAMLIKQISGKRLAQVAPVATKLKIPDEVLAIFRTCTDTDGNLKRGAMAAVLRAACGDDAPQSGRRYQLECEKVNAWHAEYLSSLPQPVALTTRVEVLPEVLPEVKYSGGKIINMATKRLARGA